MVRWPPASVSSGIVSSTNIILRNVWPSSSVSSTSISSYWSRIGVAWAPWSVMNAPSVVLRVIWADWGLSWSVSVIFSIWYKWGVMSVEPERFAVVTRPFSSVMSASGQSLWIV